MYRFETGAARRRAELQWQELARQGEAEQAAARQMDQQTKEAARLAIADKTARLRTLRLAKEQADRAAEGALKRPRKAGKVKAA